MIILCCLNLLDPENLRPNFGDLLFSGYFNMPQSMASMV